MDKSVLILTGLPFRKYGNQSLKRFVDMFLDNDFHIIFFSGATDEKGENIIEHDRFTKNNLFDFLEIINNHKHRLTLLLKKTKKKESSLNLNKETKNFLNNKINSETILPPYNNYSLYSFCKAWGRYFLIISNNFLAVPYLIIFYNKQIKKVDLIVGYENRFTLAAKIISKLFKKKYINKFQGTLLVDTNRKTSTGVIYYPENYFGINKADLCIMVNDGTDTLYYAKTRGNKNIFHEPHGVNEDEYNHLDEEIIPKQIKKHFNSGKFIIFNNASSSTWKRIDRIIRALSYLNKNDLAKILFITTYNGVDKKELLQFRDSLGLQETVIFLDIIDHKQSYLLIRKSHLLAMTNELSNLGNPVLEAIFCGTPVITINDGSTNDFINHEIDGFLIDLNENFDKNFADTISKLVNDSDYYGFIKKNMLRNNSVNSLQVQQNKEIKKITELLNK